jgi:hypothetical protein
MSARMVPEYHFGHKNPFSQEFFLFLWEKGGIAIFTAIS